MTVNRELFERLEALAEGRRYHVSAFVWVLGVAEEARRRLDPEAHLNAANLLESHRDLGLREFGPMALDVFRHWGVEAPADLGRIAFDLAERGLLTQTLDGRPEDFGPGFDLHEAFVERYRW